MRSLHYPILLRNDQDMSAIDQRVRDRAHAFEDIDGLLLKAFLVMRIADGDRVNLYAPFYVWEDPAAMRAFLGGPLFQGVVDSFGRPAVIDRQVLEFALVDKGIVPQVATMEHASVPAKVPPADLFRHQASEHQRALRLPGLFASATVLDSSAWRVSRVRFWADEASAASAGDAAERLRVVRAVGPALHH
jgi:hypothetical protein